MAHLDATVGGASSNSYLTEDEADTYFEGRLHSELWTDLTDDEVKESALIMATRLMDAYTCFTGTATNEDQALKWPRTGMYNRNGFAIADDVIPQDLKNATAELAMILVGEDVTLQSQAEADGLEKVKAGPIEITWKDGFDFSSTTIPNGVTVLLVPSWICEEDEGIDHLFKVL
jgi:hypothetical protein